MRITSPWPAPTAWAIVALDLRSGESSVSGVGAWKAEELLGPLLVHPDEEVAVTAREALNRARAFAEGEPGPNPTTTLRVQ